MELQIIGAFAVFLLVGSNGQADECQDKVNCHPKWKPHCVTGSKLRAYMEKNCRRFCEFCIVPCHKTKYGCCLDKKTAADGPNYRGCPLKLCYDVYPTTCKSYAAKKKCRPKDSAVLYRRKTQCPYSCNFCKHLAPGDTCKDIGYGCCWDGTAAQGKNKKGCRPCIDYYPRTCKQWGEAGCKSGSYRIRGNFMERFCPVTCGFCPCLDMSKESLCRRQKRKGLCKTDKDYMRRRCAKTCNLCAKKSVAV